MNNAQQTLATTQTASLPAVNQGQMGFADLLGMTGEQGNKALQMKLSKDGKSQRYCLLPATGKGNSIKSTFGLTGGQAKARAASELLNFSTRAFAGVSGAIASGKMVMSTVVVKESGRMVVTLVPNNAIVVQAPVDLAAVQAFLAANPDAAKQLLA